MTSAIPAELSTVTKVFRPPRAWRRRPPPTVALRDVTLQVTSGEAVALLGANGAGKSVLLKLLAGLTEATSGSVKVFGRDVAAQPRAIRASIGLASCDERSFYWRLTGTQNLEFFARLHGLGPTAARQRLAALADDLDLRATLDKPYGQLSAGNRQRLAIARALLMDPPLLLLDEPTRSLDPLAAKALRALLAAHVARGRTVLLATHDLAEAEQLGSRIAILQRGRLLACGAPARLRAELGLTPRWILTLAQPLGAPAIRALQASWPAMQTEGNVVRFLADQADQDQTGLDHALAVLVTHGCRVTGCQPETPGLAELFDRIVAKAADE